MRLVALVVLALAAQEKNPQPLALGSPAPDFSLPGVDGKTYALKDFADRKLLLVLFDTVHCPTSQLYEERIKKIVEDYGRKGVGVVSISPNHPKSVRLDELGYSDLDDSFESMKIRARDHTFNFPFCFDGEPNNVSQAYGPKATPHAFLFDAGRKLRYQGGVDDSEWPDRVKVHHLRNALDALLEGKEPPVTTSRVFGCSTKWPNKQRSVEEYNAKIAKEPVALKGAEREELRDLRKVEPGGLRLVHVWSAADPSQLKPVAETFHMYRHRKLAVATVALGGASDEALAALRKQPSSHPNYHSDDKDKLREALDPEWTGQAPFTILVNDANKVLYRKQGPLDDLIGLRRAIVANLNKEDRKR